MTCLEGIVAVEQFNGSLRMLHVGMFWSHLRIQFAVGMSLGT